MVQYVTHRLITGTASEIDSIDIIVGVSHPADDGQEKEDDQNGDNQHLPQQQLDKKPRSITLISIIIIAYYKYSLLQNCYVGIIKTLYRPM